MEKQHRELLAKILLEDSYIYGWDKSGKLLNSVRLDRTKKSSVSNLPYLIRNGYIIIIESRIDYIIVCLTESGLEEAKQCYDEFYGSFNNRMYNANRSLDGTLDKMEKDEEEAKKALKNAITEIEAKFNVEFVNYRPWSTI